MTDNEIRAVISKYLKIRVKNQKDLLDKTGITESTFYRKMAKPENFSVRELRLIFDYLKVPATERNI